MRNQYGKLNMAGKRARHKKSKRAEKYKSTKRAQEVRRGKM